MASKAEGMVSKAGRKVLERRSGSNVKWRISFVVTFLTWKYTHSSKTFTFSLLLWFAAFLDLLQNYSVTTIETISQFDL